MAGEHRSQTTAVDWLRRLEAEPFRFGFYAALRRLEAIFADRPRIGYAARPRDEPVRIGQVPSLAFAPASLASFSRRATSADGWRLQTFFFGLLGPNGPLPLHLTEYAYDRLRSRRDRTLAAFLDLFQHRLATFFYRAWADAQPAVQFDRPEGDRFSTHVGSLLGIGMDSLRRRDAMPDVAKLHFAGHFACQTRHASGLAAVLQSYLQVGVRMEQFVGQWLELPADCRMSLGRGTAGVLGSSAVIGRKIWDRQQTFRLELGPMSLHDYNRMLPGGESLRRLTAVVHNYVGLTLRWDVRLVLRREEIPGVTLGRQGKLGWTTWLAKRRPTGDARELVLRRGLEAA